MIANIDIYNNVFELLNKNIDFFTYKPTLTKDSRKLDNRFPLIFLKEVNNVDTQLTTRYEESEQTEYMTVYIYAKDIVTDDGSIVPKIDVARTLWQEVDTILDTIKIRRRGIEVIPNLETAIYEIAIDYSLTMNNRRIFR